jgi:DNA-binding beta-propeller fold protein YncE
LGGAGGAAATSGMKGAGAPNAGGAAGETALAGAPNVGGAMGMAGAPPGPPKIVLVAGTGTGDDGSPATEAAVLNPYGTVVDPVSGELYIAEVDTGKIRHIDASGVIATVVGPGAPGAAGNIVLNQPHDLLFQPATEVLFIADTMNGNVYRLDVTTGEAAMFVGPSGAFPGVSRVYCLAFAPNGTDLYYTGPDDVRVIDLAAMATKPAVPYPAARVIAIDSKGTLYAVENRPNGDSLQVVDAAGGITDMPATVNVVSDPKHITLDRDDNVLIADTELFYLRRYDVKADTLETLVGNGMSGTGTLGGDPKNAQLKRPHGVFEDKKTGEIYISDSENDRVLKITR